MPRLAQGTFDWSFTALSQNNNGMYGLQRKWHPPADFNTPESSDFLAKARHLDPMRILYLRGSPYFICKTVAWEPTVRSSVRVRSGSASMENFRAYE